MTIYQYPPNKQAAHSIGIQCNLLSAPPLHKLTKAEDQQETDISDQEDTDIIDLDTSFQISQEDTTTE